MIIAISLFLASGAASPWPISPDKLPLHLQPLAGATHVMASGTGGELGVHYDLPACYPASVQLEMISKRLPREWVPRKENFLNPGMPTSQVRGWTHYDDLTTHPRTYVDLWSGEWEDKSGRILTYDLLYRSRTPNAPRCSLEITASQLSAEAVRALGSSAGHRSGPVDSPAKARPAAIPIVNPDFIVLRPLQKQAPTGATAASIDGKQLYFKSSERILDLRQLAPETASVQQTPDGKFLVMIGTTTEGAKALRAWTSAHLNQQIGVFLENRLIDAPTIRSELDGMIVVNGQFTRAQAEEVKKRLQRGGAP